MGPIERELLGAVHRETRKKPKEKPYIEAGVPK